MATTTPPQRRPQPARYPSPRPQRSSSLPIALGLGLGVLALLIFAPIAYYASAPWRLEREVRQAAYARYVNLADADRVRTIVDLHHTDVYGRCFPESRRRTEERFEARTYGRLMDEHVQAALLEPASTPQAAAPAAAATEAATAPPPPPSHELRITAILIERTADEAADDPTSVPYRLTITLEDDARDVLVADTPPLQLTLTCPTGAPYTMSLPGQDGVLESTGATLRFGFQLTIPAVTVRESAGGCRVDAVIRDAIGQEASFEGYAVLR